MDFCLFIGEERTVVFKRGQGIVLNEKTPSAGFDEFLASVVKRVGGIKECLVCIPSSLTDAELNDFKTIIYKSGIGHAEFVPSVVANVYKFSGQVSDTVFSSVVEGDSIDMAIIKNGEIVAGGTMDDLELFDIARAELLAGQKMPEYNGTRIDVIMGAGVLIGNKKLLDEIIARN